MISAIGFFLSLAIDIAYIIDSSSTKPWIVRFLATKRGISYSPNAQKID